MGSVGDALDNALMESTIGLYKSELVDHDRRRSCTGPAELERETASWVHWYNKSRIHYSIGKNSPIEYKVLRIRLKGFRAVLLGAVLGAPVKRGSASIECGAAGQASLVGALGLDGCPFADATAVLSSLSTMVVHSEYPKSSN
jgi:hypothetical protein